MAGSAKRGSLQCPASLSYVPNKRKPWQVNLIFKGDPFDFDKDGFYATILNLHRQDLVEILSDEANDLKIRLLKEPADAEDDYERSVLNFLHKDAVDGVFSYNSFERKIESLRNRAYNDSTSALNELNEICGNMTNLMAGPGEAFGREFFTNYDKAKAMMAILPIALIAGTGFYASYLQMTILNCIWVSTLQWSSWPNPASQPSQLLVPSLAGGTGITIRRSWSGMRSAHSFPTMP